MVTRQMKRPSRLSATFVKTVTAPGRYGDGRGGHGLSLLVKVTKTGRLSKTWAQRIRIDGRAHNIGLGAYPVVSLSRARARALEIRQAVEEGRNPLLERVNCIPTFTEAVEQVIANHRGAWKPGSKSEAQWRASLRDYAMERLGPMPVDKITSDHVHAVLLPIWNSKRETARRLRDRIGAVMKWAIVKRYRVDNPAGDALGEALPRAGQQVVHHAALPYREVGSAVAKLRSSRAALSTKLAIEFLILTAARSGEVRLARWDEIDADKAMWTQPAEHTKAQRAHRVPLSRRAVQVVKMAEDLRDRSGLVFPSVTGRALSDNTLSKLLREQNIGCVPHGFRSSFRDWCRDNEVSRELAEAALAHSIGSPYARSDLAEQRRPLMEQWAEYLAK